MFDFISEKFFDITSKCLEKKAKEHQADKKDMQLVFKLGNNEDGVEYLIYKSYSPVEVVSFLNVLGVKIDFKGYSLFVPKFINGALNRFSDENDIEKSKVRVILSFNEKDEMILWIYNDKQYVKQITFESLFSTEDLLNEN